MDTLLHVGLSNAVAAAALAVLAAAVGSVCRRPALAHGLWLLVLLKLLTPPLVLIPVPWPSGPEEAAPAPVPAAAPAEAALPPAPPAEDSPPAVAAEGPAPEPAAGVEEAPPANPPPAVAAAPAAEEKDTPAPAAAPPPAPWSWARLLGTVWLLGSAGWFLLAGYRLNRFRRLLAHARPAPVALQELARRLAKQLGLGRCPGVWLLPGRLAPMLWAAGGPPRLLLPAGLIEQVSVEGWSTLLAHELAHLRRRDHWVRALEFLALGLYWWHPVAWYARRELREAEEQCCDAWVVATLPGARKTYAAALLDTLDFLSDAPPALPLLASGLGQVTDLKRRLTMIMRGTTPQSLGWLGCLAVLCLAAVLPVLPSRAQAPGNPGQEDLIRKDVADPAGDAPADVKRAEAQLRALEAQLEQKKADLAAARAHLDAARAARNKAREDAFGRANGAGNRPGSATVRIEITVQGKEGVAALNDLVKKLQGLQGKGVQIHIHRGDRPGPDANKIPPAGYGFPRPGQNVPPGSVMPPGASNTIPYYGSWVTPRSNQQQTDRLEKMLRSIQRELEELRRELKGTRRGAHAAPTPVPAGVAPATAPPAPIPAPAGSVPPPATGVPAFPVPPGGGAGPAPAAPAGAPATPATTGPWVAR